MKPAMIFGVAMMAAIILMATSGIHFGEVGTLNVPESMLGDVLYLCPAASNGWDEAGRILSRFSFDIYIGLFFAAIILLFAWGWALYQNLLKDKFNQDTFTNVWGFTKIFFWALIIVLLVIKTPNYYRTVQVRGYQGDYVLCESNSLNAIAVRQDAVFRAK